MFLSHIAGFHPLPISVLLAVAGDVRQWDPLHGQVFGGFGGEVGCRVQGTDAGGDYHSGGEGEFACKEQSVDALICLKVFLKNALRARKKRLM